MSDKIDTLKSVSQWFFDRMDHTNPDDENGIAVTAMEWAIDQLRWRRVEDELPNEDGDYLVVIEPLTRPIVIGRLNDQWYPPSMGAAVTKWRPIESPEAP